MSYNNITIPRRKPFKKKKNNKTHAESIQYLSWCTYKHRMAKKDEKRAFTHMSKTKRQYNENKFLPK